MHRKAADTTRADVFAVAYDSGIPSLGWQFVPTRRVASPLQLACVLSSVHSDARSDGNPNCRADQQNDALPACLERQQPLTGVLRYGRSLAKWRLDVAAGG